MAEALTYDSLVSDIQLYTERSDIPFITQIPRLIMMAENRIASEARGLGFLRVANVSITAGNHILEKPSRWRETKQLSITTAEGVKFLRSRGYPYCRAYWPDVSVRDEPVFYADYDYEHYLIAPTPVLTYTGEISYYERPEPLSVDNQTNWTTQYAPQLILYACLLEAQPFLKMQERIAEFQGLYDRALQMLKMEDTLRISDVVSNRSEA
jgi:hypothetical protein